MTGYLKTDLELLHGPLVPNTTLVPMGNQICGKQLTPGSSPQRVFLAASQLNSGCHFKLILLPQFHSDCYINGHQHRRCNSQRTPKRRGRCRAIGKVRTVYIARLPVSECRRLVAKAFNESVTELVKDNDTRMSQYVHTEPRQSGTC